MIIVNARRRRSMHAHGTRGTLPMETDVWTSFAHAMTADWCDVGQMTIDILPDDVLIEIFNYYINPAWTDVLLQTQDCQMPVHVCQRL
jgi:hypothetical protein